MKKKERKKERFLVVFNLTGSVGEFKDCFTLLAKVLIMRQSKKGQTDGCRQTHGLSHSVFASYTNGIMLVRNNELSFLISHFQGAFSSPSLVALVLMGRNGIH